MVHVAGNPGPGGFAAIIIYEDRSEEEVSGGEAITTNNRMEIMAVIEALKKIDKSKEVEIYSDSTYVVNGINLKWAFGWRANGWVKKDGNIASNANLWEELLDLLDGRNYKINKVKGHSNNEYNNRCDKLAVMESKKF